MKRIFAFLLLLTMLIPLFAACSGGGQGGVATTPGTEKSAETTSGTTGSAETTGAPDQDRVSLTGYSVVVSPCAADWEKSAADAVAGLVSGAVMTTQTAEKDEEILIGWTEREACLAVDYDSLETDGYALIFAGKKLLLAANSAVGMNAAGAAALVGAIGIVNGLGRLAWSTLSDWMGRAATYVLFFVIETAAFFALAQTPSEAVFYILVLTIISSYGGGFSCMPAFLSDLFGVRQLSSIHGIMLTAWALAGIAGPMLLSVIKETTGSYHQTMLVFAGLMSAALVLSVILKVKSTKH